MSEPSISVVSVFVDTPKATPITKKLSEILAENIKLRVRGIRRRDAHCEEIVNPQGWFAWQVIAMQWSEDWNAWSCRPATGIYQQIIIFVPRGDDE